MNTVSHIDIFKQNMVEVLPSGFSIKGGYLNYKNDEEDIQVCGAVKVLASTRSENDLNYGKLLQWVSTENVTITWAMPLLLLEGDPKLYMQVFADRGLETPNDGYARRLLKQYLKSCRPSKKLVSVSTLGWYKQVYITPLHSYGQNAENYIYQSRHSQETPLNTTRHQDWLTHVFSYCKHNHKLIFVVCAALTPVLLKHKEQNNIGFHFHGESSKGKTTLLKVANSLWGDAKRLRRWNATQNGLEAIATDYNDGLLCLDEIKECPSRHISNTVYMLGNGQGRMRANRDGLSKDTASFRLLYLSNGEMPVEQAISNSGERVFSGQEVRLIDIAGDDAKYGAFDYTNELEAKNFAEQINQNTEQYYNVIGHFIEKLTDSLDDNLSAYNSYYDIAKESARSMEGIKQLDSAALRALDHFAFVGAVGELAIQLKFIDLNKGEALESMKQCIKSWLSSRGKVSGEKLGVLTQLESGLNANLDRIAISQNDDITHQPIGYTVALTDNKKEYIILSSEFYKFFNGYGKKQLNNYLHKEGIIKQFNDGRYNSAIRFRGNTYRCHIIYPDKLVQCLEKAD